MAEVFRKEALERAARPDQLDDYINVSNPSVWVILGAILAFLIGLGVWCVFGHISDVRTAALYVDNGTAIMYMQGTSAGDLSRGDEVAVGDTQGHVTAVESQTSAGDAASSDSAIAADAAAQSQSSSGSSVVMRAVVDIDLPDGTYQAKVTVGELDPIQLLLNRS